MRCEEKRVLTLKAHKVRLYIGCLLFMNKEKKEEIIPFPLKCIPGTHHHLFLFIPTK